LVHVTGVLLCCRSHAQHPQENPYCLLVTQSGQNLAGEHVDFHHQTTCNYGSNFQAQIWVDDIQNWVTTHFKIHHAIWVKIRNSNPKLWVKIARPNDILRFASSIIAWKK